MNLSDFRSRVVLMSCFLAISLTVKAQTDDTASTSSSLTDISIGFAGQISTPSCQLTLNDGASRVVLPDLDSESLDKGNPGPLTTLQISFGWNLKDPVNASANACDMLLLSTLQLSFDTQEMSLSPEGLLQNTLKSIPSTNVLVEVVRYSDDLSRFEPLNLQLSPVLNLRSGSRSLLASQAQVNLGFRYVKDTQSTVEVQAGGFTAYMPFLMKYD